jgi:hypothetical protein
MGIDKDLPGYITAFNCLRGFQQLLKKRKKG